MGTWNSQANGGGGAFTWIIPPNHRKGNTEMSASLEQYLAVYSKVHLSSFLSYDALCYRLGSTGRDVYY